MTAATPTPAAGDRLDAAVWMLLSVAVLGLVPIGFVSNDGLGHSREFAAGTWSLNPNHLLFEPSGALWQELWAHLDPTLPGVDALKLLSALAGGLAVALARLRVLPFVTARRWAANYGAAWVALSSAFLRLWVSDEIHMIQMPLVVVFAAEALRLIDGPTWRRGARAGVAAALATLCFVSNLLLGLSLGLLLLFDRRDADGRRAARSAALALVVTAALALAPAYAAATLHARGAARAGGAIAWLSHGRLGGGSPLARGESGYGLESSPRGLATAALRALYGSASAVVDLSPLAAAARDRAIPTAAAICGAVAFLAAAAGGIAALRHCLRAERASAARIVGRFARVFLAPVLAFGFLWSNSDDQFYLALAPVFGLLAAVAATQLQRRRLWLVLGLAALAWNLADVTRGRILYPRAERLAQVEAATAGACLVVLPGFDEAELIFDLSPAKVAVEHLSIAALATSLPSAEGLKLLVHRVAACTQRGGRVVFLDLFDVPGERNPWRYLRRLGYSHDEVLRVLEDAAGAAATVRLGSFSVRAIP